MSKLSVKLFFASMAITLVLSSCGKTDSNSHPKDTLRVAINDEPPTLDPLLVDDISSARPILDLFSGLVDFDQANNPVPGMATKWDISSDGKMYTFHLRHDLKFSDGSPITASDFVYSWQRMADPKTASPVNYLMNNIVNGKSILAGKQDKSSLGVKAPDDYTLVVNLVHSDNDFIKYLAISNFAVVPQKVIEKFGDKWTDPKNIVTSGAYVLKEHVVNGHLLAEKNSYYYDKAAVSIPNVRYLVFNSRNTDFATYKSGGVDITADLPVDLGVQIAKDYPDEFKRTGYEALVMYDFNMQIPLFKNNVKLRQALSMAIDRETLINKVLHDEIRTPSYGVATTTIDDGKYANIQYPWGKWPREKQITEAKKLYAEAGYGPQNPLQLTVLYNTDEGNKKRTLAIAAMWTEVLGANVKVENQDWKTFLQSRHKGNFVIARDGQNAAYNSISFYAELYRCNGLQNNSQYCNPAYDSLINNAATINNPELRRKAYTQALTLALDDYPIMPIYQPTYSRLVKPYVHNYVIKDNHLDLVQSKWLSLGE